MKPEELARLHLKGYSLTRLASISGHACETVRRILMNFSKKSSWYDYRRISEENKQRAWSLGCRKDVVSTGVSEKIYSDFFKLCQENGLTKYECWERLHKIWSKYEPQGQISGD